MRFGFIIFRIDRSKKRPLYATRPIGRRKLSITGARDTYHSAVQTPSPAGSRYAANVKPETTSLRRDCAVTVRSQEAACIHPTGRIKFNGNGPRWICRQGALRSGLRQHSLQAKRQLP